MARKKTHDEFVSEVFNLAGDEYEIMDKYINSQTYLKFFHKKCGKEFKMIPNAFLRGRRCPHCFGNKRKTTEEFKQEVFDLVGEEYEVIGEYRNTNTLIKMRHNACGGIYEVRPRAFLRGARCSRCFRPVKKTQEQFEKEIFDLVGNEYTVLGKYKTLHTKVLMRHNECGYEYEVTPAHFITTGRRCPKCKGGVKRKNYNFEKHVFEISNGEYKPLSKYVNNKTHVLMKHNICGNIWGVRPDNFFSGKGCPACNESLGERKIRKFLTDNKISFISQYKFEDCKNERPLPFDFAITDNEDNVIALIEFDGEQHYRPVQFFGGLEGYKKRKKNDQIKINYCKTNHIPLLIIKHNDNIDETIKDFLNTMPTLSQAHWKQCEGATTR